ncbi:MAG: PAS domain S-box protein, partial [Candidatus Heimdallarchaeota archaeon]
YAMDFAFERANERREFSNINTEYQELFNSVPIGLYKTDFKGNIIHCNKYLVNLLGYNKESDLLNFKIQDFMIAREQENDPFLGLLKKSPLARGKVQLRKKDGSLIWTEIETQATLSQEKILLYLHASVKDITEQITLENEISSSYEKMQFYLDSAETYFVVINRDESIAFVNDKMAKIHGLKSSEMIGKNWIETSITADSRIKLQKAFNEIIKGNVEKYHNQELNYKIDGKTRTISWKNTFVKDKNDQVTTIISSGTDVTDFKKSEELLKENEEKYRKLVETSPDAIISGDLNGIIEYANKQMYEAFGFQSEEEIIGRNIIELVHPSNREDAIRFIGETISKGHMGTSEIQMIRKNGQTFPIEFNTSVLYNSGNEPIGIIALGRDISDRKEAEEELFRSEAKFRQLFNMANDAVMLLKISEEKILDEIIEVNTKACEKYGYTKDELLGLSISDLIDPDHRSNIPKNMAKLFMKGQTTHECLHITKDNRKIPVELSSHIFKFENEEVVLSIIRDITERKKAEEALKNSEELYRSIFENTGTSMVVLDLNNKIVISNSLFENLVGFSKENLISKNWRSLVYENDLEVINKIAKERLSYSNLFPMEIEFRIKNKKGNLRNIWAVVAAIHGTNQTVVSLHDITEKSIMEEVKKQAFDQIDKNMGQFAILVDCIRNPLSIIVGLSDIQNNEISRKIIEQAKLIDDIIKQLDYRWLESSNVKNFLSEHL